MFGMGGSEILVILIVALLFLGPDKLPEAAKTISKGIRDIKKQSRNLQQTIENDERIGGAIRDLKSALRGEDEPYRPPPKKKVEIATEEDEKQLAAAAAAAEAVTPEPIEQIAAAETAARSHPAAPVPDAKPASRFAPTAGEIDPDTAPPTDEDDAELAAMIKPAVGIVAKGSTASDKRHG